MEGGGGGCGGALEKKHQKEWGHTYTEFINLSSIVDWKLLRKPSFFSLTTAILRTIKSELYQNILVRQIIMTVQSAFCFYLSK